MNILEQEIEQVVWDAIEEGDHDLLQKRGLPIYFDYKYVRQLDLGAYGRADLIGFKVYPSTSRGKEKVRLIDIQVFELKKEQVNASTFFQAIRYIKGLKEKFKHEHLNYTLNFSIHLIGKSINEDSDFIYMPDIFSRIHYYTYSISLRDGIVFIPETGYSLVDPCFSKKADIKSILKSHVEDALEGQRIRAYFDRVDAEKAAKGELPTAPEDMPF
jgi:hypothetical protein